MQNYLLLLICLIALLSCTTVTARDQRLSNRAFDQLRDGHYRQAEEYLQQALALNPNNPYAILNMGVVYGNTGRPGKACEMYQKVLRVEAEENPARTSQQWAEHKNLKEIAEKNMQGLRGIRCEPPLSL